MKSIANQYRDLKEGRMSQGNFMRNLRMAFPQYVTNVTSFDDAVRILKNKAILSEGNISEAKKKKEAKTELHPNQIHPQELRMGIKVELEHTDDIDKAKKIALDHLAENPFYYTQLKLSGVDVQALPSKEKKAIAKKKDETELVDKANQMQKVKMPKVVKEGLNEDHAFDRESQIEYIKNSGRFQGNLDNKSDEFIEKLYKSLEDSSNKMSGVDLGGSFDKFKSTLAEIVREVVNEYYFDGRDNLVDDIAAEID